MALILECLFEIGVQLICSFHKSSCSSVGSRIQYVEKHGNLVEQNDSARPILYQIIYDKKHLLIFGCMSYVQSHPSYPDLLGHWIHLQMVRVLNDIKTNKLTNQCSGR